MRRRFVPFAAAMVLTQVTLATAFGWSQLRNNFDSGTPTSCNNVSPWICIEWPTTSGGLSVNENVYLDSSLVYQGLIVNLKQDARDTFPRWNGIAARNPHLQETTDLNLALASGLVVFADSDLPNGVYAATLVHAASSTSHKIAWAQTEMSTNILWNHSLDFSSFQPPDPTEPRVYSADSRKVLTHEVGHSEGLGHTSYAAIMRQGAATFYTVQSNDVTGIVAVYGTYP